MAEIAGMERRGGSRGTAHARNPDQRGDLWGVSGNQCFVPRREMGEKQWLSRVVFLGGRTEIRIAK